VKSFELFKVGGPATTVHSKRSFAHDPHDAVARRATKEAMIRSPVRFTSAARDSIAASFGECCQNYGFRIHACAISHDHVHLILARDAVRTIEQVATVLKAKATMRMTRDQNHPCEGMRPVPTPWAKKCWSVFIEDDLQLIQAIQYVQRHPLKDGTGAQQWDWISPV